ncbi:MAG: hypothetical protein Q7R47_02470, partial [Candidatus Diapherotrites archaeon]|nr:hypothetical protein [Candidatus Diapherotrites archaeon]
MKCAILLGCLVFVLATIIAVHADSTAVGNFSVSVIETPPPDGDQNQVVPPSTDRGSAGGSGGTGAPLHLAEILFLNTPESWLGENAVISVGIKNRSKTAGVFSVTVTVSRNGEVVHSYPSQRIPMAPDDNQIVVFDSWSPVKTGDYTVIARVFGPGKSQAQVEKAGRLKINGVFRFDIQIEEYKRILRPGEDQNLIILLHNKGDVEDDLELLYWIENPAGTRVSYQSLTLTVPSNNPIRLNLKLPFSGEQPTGTYRLVAQIRFGKSSATAETPFEVPPANEYRTKVLEELEQRLAAIGAAIDAKRAGGYDTGRVEETYQGLFAKIKKFREDSE